MQWKKYRTEQPTKGGEYLCLIKRDTYSLFYGRVQTMVRRVYKWEEERKMFVSPDHEFIFGDIVAWAEIPAYEEGE